MKREYGVTRVIQGKENEYLKTRPMRKNLNTKKGSVIGNSVMNNERKTQLNPKSEQRLNMYFWCQNGSLNKQLHSRKNNADEFSAN